MSDQIIRGKRRNFLSENPDSRECEMKAQFLETRDEILQREFEKIRDIRPDQMIIQTFNGKQLLNSFVGGFFGDTNNLTTLKD